MLASVKLLMNSKSPSVVLYSPKAVHIRFRKYSFNFWDLQKIIILRHSPIYFIEFLKQSPICKPFKEPMNRFSVWWAGTTTIFNLPARKATYAGGIDYLESIPGLLNHSQIRAQDSGLYLCRGSWGLLWFDLSPSFAPQFYNFKDKFFIRISEISRSSRDTVALRAIYRVAWHKSGKFSAPRQMSYGL